ncbi:SUMF1/EgtB/PvdO family nonheme iron enzyme [Roseobacter sp. OBYS 0001]|uniref:formylglycine-generating enzyme family protein n=1 Tax=Roseobacter sp. OBYS 0001 TaxID=882651 RepID=UPI001BC0192B|nr:SUMF1/EgtB/PvdO family nonheme iron enzyme [Roseobacter sp. OBYS 0001]GIT88753.1 hypothetical protein ROBYS_37690 [Roseobacter sp. OBYS 0001]
MTGALTKITRSYLSMLAGGAVITFCAGALHAAQNQQPPDYSTLGAVPFTSANAPSAVRASETMLTIQGGPYTLGRNDGPAIERRAHSVTLEGFRMDRTEVTNAAFAEYLNALDIQVLVAFEAGGVSAKHLSQSGIALLTEGRSGSGLYPLIALDDDQARIGHDTDRFVPTEGYADHPVAETTWAGARAYCHWRGARLPTEAEWEAAARGSDAFLYPWGNTAPDPTRVFTSGRTGVTGAVGGRPAGASPLGVLDLSGSLAEWTSSLLRAYPYDPKDGREDNTLAGERVTRGGDYIYDADAATLTATHRDGFSNASERGHRHIGFRCAADLQTDQG